MNTEWNTTPAEKLAAEVFALRAENDRLREALRLTYLALPDDRRGFAGSTGVRELLGLEAYETPALAGPAQTEEKA